ncbi:hypothetical protein ACOSQ4_009339 [Xanthoceras sorbifolium]
MKLNLMKLITIYKSKAHQLTPHQSSKGSTTIQRFGQLRILGLPSQQFLSIFLLGGLRSVLFWDIIELLVSAPIGSTLRRFCATGCDRFLPSSFFSDLLTVRDWCARIRYGAVLLGGFLGRSVSSPIVRLGITLLG